MAPNDRRFPQTPLLPLSLELDDFSDSIPLTYLSQHTSIPSSPTRGSSDAEFDALTEHASEPPIPLIEPDDRIKRQASIASLNTSAVTRSGLVSFIARMFESISDATHSLDISITQLTRESRFHGWRMGVLLGCCMSTFVLCCNIAIIIVGASTASGYNADGISDIIVGNEATISKWNTALHVLVNALSTMLLAGGNYTMQVLSSPTREDIDVAHAKGQWLDIGILSPRNLWTIPLKRTLLWYTLALSSIHLYLFYNASIFKVITSSGYNILTLDILSDEWKRISSITDHGDYTIGEYWNMSNSQWNDVYNTEYVDVHGDLFLAIDRVAFDTNQFPTNSTISETISRCLPLNTPGNLSYLKTITLESPLWIRYAITLNDDQRTDMNVSAHVAEAASQKRQSPPSRVQTSLHFLVVVVVFNLVKLVVMIYVLVTDRSAYIVTLGDAVASFLERSDPHTTGKCLLGREEFLATMKHPPAHPVSNLEERENLGSRIKGIWLPRRRRYFFTVHRMATKIYDSIFIIVTMLISIAPIYFRNSTGPWQWGAASTDTSPLSRNSITTTATLWNAWIANAPQLVLSFCYITVNTICTSMAGAGEWNHFASSKKGLRVTKPHGNQRSTYFLQLPYKWSIPLVITSGALHWLLSQTFFLVRVDFFTREGQMIKGESKSACGLSALSLLVFLFGLLLLLGTIGFVGLRRMPTRIPIVASCSLAISAACHPPVDEIEPHLEKVRWGVTGNELVQGFGHCSFTSKPVKKPTVGVAYR